MLAPDLDRMLGDALAAELAKVEADEAAAYDAAARSSARAGRNLYNVHVTRAGKVRASADGVALESLLRDISEQVSLPSEVLREASRRTVAGAAAEIGGGIAADVKSAAGTFALVGAPVLILVALAAAVLFFPRFGR